MTNPGRIYGTFEDGEVIAVGPEIKGSRHSGLEILLRVTPPVDDNSIGKRVNVMGSANYGWPSAVILGKTTLKVQNPW